MLPPSVVNEIRRLLAGEGLSYRKITRITGVSRGTIGKIAAGRGRTTRPCAWGAATIPWSRPARRSAARDAAGWSISPAAFATRGS